MRGKLKDLNIPFLRTSIWGMGDPNYVKIYFTLSKQHVSKNAFDILIVGQKWWGEDISYVAPCIILRGCMVVEGGGVQK